MPSSGKLFYTVGELAGLAQVSDNTMRRHLVAAGVQFTPIGTKKHVVYRSSLAAALPEMLDSMKLSGVDE